MAPSDLNPRGLRPDSSTASTVSFAGFKSQKAPQLPPGFIGDRPRPYNAGLSLEGAMTGATIVNATNAGSGYAREKAAPGLGGRFSAINLNALLREAGQPWLMGPSPDIGDKGEIGAVVGSSAVANAGDLFP